MRLLYDLDDTVAHFRRRFNEVRATEFPTYTGIPILDNHPSFNLWEGRTEDEQKVISQIMDWQNFYLDLEPYEGAVDAVKEAVAMGHEVFFLSAPWVTNKTGASDKYAWVEKHFGLDLAKKLILSREKTIITGDILFDDKHPIPGKENATWTQVYVDAPYNRDQPGYRIQDWTTDEWKNIVDVIQAEKQYEAAKNAIYRPIVINVPTQEIADQIKVINFA